MIVLAVAGCGCDGGVDGSGGCHAPNAVIKEGLTTATTYNGCKAHYNFRAIKYNYNSM